MFFRSRIRTQCNQAIEIIGTGDAKASFSAKSGAEAIHVLGPAYDMFGPLLGNIHLIMKGFKREFDPGNLSNPGYATRPDVVSPEELKKMMGGH